MEWKDMLGQLVDWLKLVGPELWRMARLQVYATAVEMYIWAVGLSIGSVILGRLGKQFAGKHESWHDNWDIAAGFTIAFCVILIMVAFGMFIGATKRIIGTDFYVIRILIGLVKSTIS